MRKYTPLMNRLNLIALIVDGLWIVLALYFALGLYNVIQVPANPEQVQAITYTYLGFEMAHTTVNLLISLLVFYLIFFFPTWIIAFKRFRERDLIDLDEWGYRYPLLIGVISILSTNVIGGVLHLIVANKVKWMIKGYGYLQSLKNVFKKETYSVLKEAFKKKQQTESEYEASKDVLVAALRKFGVYAFLVFVALVMFIPFYWMVLTALKTFDEINQLSPSYFVALSDLQWVNFKVALNSFDFVKYMTNTVVVAMWATIGTLFTTIFAAYAFARLEFKGRDFIFTLLLMTMMIPGELFVITNYVTVASPQYLSWNNTMQALVVPFMTSVFYIFFLRQTFKQIPDSLYRAARVDGCGDFKYLTRVMVPIAAPTIITITILNALGTWNAYVWPNLVTEEPLWMVAVALRNTSFTAGAGEARTLFNIQLAASAAVTIPIIIVFLLLRKYIMAGVGRSGTKG